MQLQAIKVGMRLKEDALDPRGTVLVRAGTLLTAHHLHIFRAWGVTELSVETRDIPRDTPDNAAVDDDLRKLLDTRFALANRHHPAMQVLYDYCLKHASGTSK